MKTTEYLLIINGKDKTEQVRSCQYSGQFYTVVYNGSSPKEYFYRAEGVYFHHNPQEID